MTGRRVYMSRCYRNLTAAGNKAKTDNETTMQELGFINIGLPQRVSSNGLLVFFYDLAGVVKACLAMRRGDVLLLQYPVKKYFSLLCNAAHMHGTKVITIIHDLGSFRRKKLTVEKEISRLSHADSVVASNEVMAQWLKDNGMKRPVVSLGLFDYRSDARAEGQGTETGQHDSGSAVYRIAYAGSLAPRKNAFFLRLPQIASGYELHIFGNGDSMPALKEAKSFVFHNFTPSDAFIAHNGCDFGLVWDGDSLDGCTGSFGGYLRYNSPHKASFYLRAGLPVIVWKDAAIAHIIESEGIGFTISSLRELPKRLSEINYNELAAMRKNVAVMADKLNNGYFFKKAIREAVSSLAPLSR